MNTNSMSSLTNTVLSGYSAMNNMKAQLALSGKSGNGAAPSLSSLTSTTSSKLSSEATGFLKDYRSNLEAMKAAAKDVASNKSGNRLAAGTEDAGVATVSGNLAKATDSYAIHVEQLSAGQVNRSATFTGSATLPTEGGALRIETEKGNFNLSLSAAGYKTNADMLKGYADKVNALNAGVTAKVVEDKDGSAYLAFSGDGAFALSGSFAERTGLDQVAEKGQEAVFTVTKNGTDTQKLTSSNNTVEIDGMTVNLRGVGETTIGAGQSETDRVADHMEKLVSSFNKTLSFLNKNEDWGMGVLNQIKRMIILPTSEKSLKQIGVSVASDGSLSFNRATFSSAMERDPSLAMSTVNRLADDVGKDATSGLNQSSYNLVGNALTGGASSSAFNGYDTDTISFLNAYSKSGAYNTMNMMALGVLLNLSV